MRPRTTAPVALAFALLTASPAPASEASADEVRALAARAQQDPTALEQLRSIDSVDGKPVDLRTALDAPSPRQVQRRLVVLADGADYGSPPATQARGEAREVLAGRQFRKTDVPKPFKGILDALGRRLRSIGSWLTRLADRVSGGHGEVVLIALAIAAAALVAVVIARLLARRAPLGGQAEAGRARRRPDPSDLERRAAEAEAAGDLELALRLRFLAGLARLGAARVIEWRPSMTSGEVAAVLRSPDFEAAATTFDEVVYGRRPPRPEDLEASKGHWARVLEASAR